MLPRMADVEHTVVNALKGVLKRRNKSVEVDFDTNSDFFDDLELDSLDVAELSAVLEDDLGSDPYSDGLAPRTVAEVVAFYN